MSRILRSVAAAFALLLSLLVPALAGAAPAPPPPLPTPPPTLTGETFQSFATAYNDNTFTCTSNDPFGTGDVGGTFSFTADGTAVGPYSGPFHETGSAKIASDGTLTAFTANFTVIDPTLGTVTGTKTLASGTGACLLGAVVYADAVTTYTATITTPTGISYTDHGSSNAQVNIGSPLTQSTFINESFASSQTTTTLVVPTSADQCKNGGYVHYLDPSTAQPFTNQGRCIQYVNTGK